MFKNIKLGTRLISGFIAVIIVTTIIGLVGIFSLRSVQNSNGNMKQALMGIENLLTINAAINSIKVSQVTLLSANCDDESRKREAANVDESRKIYKQEFDEYEALPKSPEQKKRWDEATVAVNSWKTENNKFFDLSNQFDKTAITNPIELERRFEQIRADHLGLRSSVSDLIASKKEFQGGEDPTACALGKYLASFKSENPVLNTATKEIVAPHNTFHTAVKHIKELMKSNNSQEAIVVFNKDFRPGAEEVMKSIATMNAEANRAVGIFGEMNKQAMGPCRDCQDKFMGLLNQIIKSDGQLADDTKKKTEAIATTSSRVMVVALVFGVLLALLMGILLTRAITKPLNRAIESLSAGSEQVAAASNQISQSSQQLAEGATEQASSLEESSSALEELAGQARGNSEKAKRATEGADLAQTTAEKANLAMAETVQTMNQIKESSGKISGIIKTIEEIAFQTNLLALNAAVEAARAGEHGKGFAVVAEEVRNLAQRSAVAAKDTAQLIETSVEQSKRGADVVGKASEAIEQILQAARAVAKDAREVTDASNEQSEGIMQINSAVAQMDQVTQQVAANAEESASASEELSAQSQQLLSIVGDLILLVGGAQACNASGTGKMNMHLDDHRVHSAASAHPAPRHPSIATHKPASQLSHHRQVETKKGKHNGAMVGAAAGKNGTAAETIPFDDDGKPMDEF